MKERRLRLDSLLVEKGLAESRARAQALILSGAVRVGDRVVTKVGSRYAPHETPTVADSRRYVSRAGEKLDAAIEEFGVAVASRACMDAGASTGGFTGVLLERGARRVLSVDVGYGQLDWTLRNDPRVTVMERTNVRHLTGAGLPFEPQLLVADLSFISLPVALAGLLGSTPSIEEAVVLVKPQFEAGRERVGRGGLVRDPAARLEAILSVVFAFSRLGFGATGICRSPVAGRRSGNAEFPVRLVRNADVAVDEAVVLGVVGG